MEIWIEMKRCGNASDKSVETRSCNAGVIVVTLNQKLVIHQIRMQHIIYVILWKSLKQCLF